MIRNTARGPFAATCCFAVMLSPVLGFFNLSYFMSGLGPDHHAAIFRADHFQYLAAVAVFAVIATGFDYLIRPTKTNLRPVLYAGSILVLFFLASLTWAQSSNYRDAETAFRAVIAKNPNSPTAQSNLGGAVLKRGAIDEAIVHSRKSLELEPNFQFGHYNLGLALLQKGNLDAAIEELREVLAINPNDFKTYYTLGNALSKKGEVDEAAASYQNALKLQPDLVDAHTNLANVLLEKAEIDAALTHYRKVVELEPDNPGSHYNLAVGLARKGEIDPAIAELRIALRIDPKYPDAEPLLRDLLAQQSR
jgi:tetratricopeptide (TPR) repeat protein